MAQFTRPFTFMHLFVAIIIILLLLLHGSTAVPQVRNVDLFRPGREKPEDCIPVRNYKWMNANCGIHVRQYRSPPYRLYVTVKGNNEMCYKTLTYVKGMLIRNCYYVPWAIKVLDLPRGGHITIEKRILYDEPGDQELQFTYGNDVWFSSDDRCSVGKWDDGEHRDMDCRFAC